MRLPLLPWYHSHTAWTLKVPSAEDRDGWVQSNRLGTKGARVCATVQLSTAVGLPGLDGACSDGRHRRSDDRNWHQPIFPQEHLLLPPSSLTISVVTCQLLFTTHSVFLLMEALLLNVSAAGIQMWPLPAHWKAILILT